MITISLCMIVKNEAYEIGRCLESVKDRVDEINIVNTGSDDDTEKVVKKYTDRVFNFKWIDDFAEARNYSFSKATKDYILWLDADDVLLEEDCIKLKKLKENMNNDIDIITFKYNYISDEEGNPLLIFRRERLVKRKRNFKWVGFVHEFIAGTGVRLDADITVTHKRIHNDSDRNLNIYKKKLSEGVQLSVRDVYYYGKELYYHGLYDEAIEILEKFLKLDAWSEEKIDTACRLAECYQYKGNNEKEREMLFKTFEYASPRGEAMFRIGNSFEREGRINEAIYWYETILNSDIPEETSGFIRPEFWTWKPNLQLSVCYYNMGNIEKAYYYHNKAYKLNSKDPLIIANDNFFKSLKK